MNNVDTHQTRYDCDFFIAFFSAIPDEQWCVYRCDDGAGRHCALGHCGVPECNPSDLLGRIFANEKSEVMAQWGMARALWEILRCDVGGISNGFDPRYQQPTPRARILAALADCKARAEAELDRYETRPLLPVTKPEPVTV